MADISKIILPNGDQHTIKDSTARSGLNDKVDKVTGKGLSTNDYTTTEKDKLAGIAAGAEANVQSDWDETDTSSDAYILNKPTIPSDFPPKSHASTATTYGLGNASNYGHVKLSDTYSSSVSGGNAAGGVAASQNALYNAYNALRNSIPVDDGLDARLQGEIEITTNADLNDYITPGEYYCHISPQERSITNYPINLAFRLRVEYSFNPNVSAGLVRQTFIPYSHSYYYVRTRESISGAYEWNDWEKLSPNIQSNWNETDTTSDAYILNKPNPYLLENFVAIPDGSDLNDYTTPGEYYVSSDSTSVSHCPRSGFAFRLRVENNPTASFIKQTFSIRVNNNLYPDPITWFRFYRVDTQVWGSWKGDTQHLMGFITIHDNEDLNDFIELGEYECSLTSRAATLSNLPSDMNPIQAFRLRVEASIQGYNGSSTTYLYRRQTLYPHRSPNIYYTRTYIIEGAGTETWSSWIKCGVPISHASSATTYGIGTESNYGHVKLSDTISSSISGGNAAGGIAASQNALASVYRSFADGSIPAGSAKQLVTTNTNGIFTDVYGNFIHLSTSTTNSWAVFAYDETFRAIQVYFETGKIMGGGTTLVWGPGDTATFSDQIAGGFFTNAQKRVSWSLPCYTSTKVADAQITALSVTLRYAAGGYAYMCYGSSNNQYQQLGTGRTSIWSSSQTVQTNGVSTVDCSVKPNHIYIWVDFVNTLRTGANTTAITNNTPMSIHFNMTIKFT